MYGIDDLKKISGMKLLLEVNTNGQKPIEWAKENKKQINELIQKNGAVLLRGININGSKVFASFIKEIFDSELLNYTYRSTPRTGFRGNIYTATEYPSTEIIQQHNENSYANAWPNRIGFFCMLPAEKGGETPIADSRQVYKCIPSNIRHKFESKGILYIRNYSEVDLPWTEVFQTQDKLEVERFCHENNIFFEWRDNGRLRTKQLNPATLAHPVTGEKVWFNQAHLFHISNLELDIAKAMLNSFGIDELPRNVFYGDGSEIEESDLTVIRQAYEDSKIAFKWEKGDLLLLDNVLFSHGREPFVGARKVLVGMSNPNSV